MAKESKTIAIDFTSPAVRPDGLLKRYRNNDAINNTGADVRMIVGRRSNGKTYPTIVNCLIDYIDNGNAFAYVRRYDSDLKSVKDDIFNAVILNGWLSWKTGGKYNNVQYYRGKWYLRHISDEGKIDKKDPEPFCYGFAINRCESYKGPDYGAVKTVIFDEFIPMRTVLGTLPREWSLWQNLISTIVRDRDDIVIYMIANTITKNSVYFDHYKIDIDEIEQGEIRVYNFTSGGCLAIEYCSDNGDANVKSSKYFDIDDSVGSAITKGTWETEEYPRLPEKYRKYKNISRFSFNLIHNNKIVQGHIITAAERSMIYFHRRTSPVRDDEYVYVEKFDNDRMDRYKTRIGFNPTRFELDRIIVNKIRGNECYYQDNDTGELIKYFFDNT